MKSGQFSTASCKTERGKVRKKPLLSRGQGVFLPQRARAAPGMRRIWDGDTWATLVRGLGTKAELGAVFSCSFAPPSPNTSQL